jgi:hypothetical protein
LLGISDTSQDTAITAKIPFIDAKVKQITKNRYNKMIVGDLVSESPYVTVASIYTEDYVQLEYRYTNGYYGYYGSGINNPYSVDTLVDYLEIGDQIEGTGIPAETYIEEVYYNGDIYTDGVDSFNVPTIKLSQNATEDAGSTRLYLGINIAYQDIIAKGIQYLINGTSTSTPGRTVISVGTVSYASEDNKTDGKYGMPSWFIKALPKYMRGH